MKKTNAPGTRSQSGFTLVELAVVMIIIGLLIGGVLKGQELINNAQIAATVAQVKSIDAATTTFRDMYAAYPGDIRTPGSRLPNCTAAPCNTVHATAGDNALNRLPNAYGAADEAASFFSHLNAADLLTGINPADGAVWGGLYPAAKIAGGFHPSSATGLVGEFANAALAVTPFGGFYLTITANPAAAPSDATGVISPNQAARIDARIDDGLPGAGSVRAFGTGCADASTPPVFLEASPNRVCGLHIRFQG